MREKEDTDVGGTERQECVREKTQEWRERIREWKIEREECERE